MTGRSHVQAVVPLLGRGGLVFADLHGVPLAVHAVSTVSQVVDDVVLVADPVSHDDGPHTVAQATWWAQTRRQEPVALLVHDPLCPLTPADFLARIAARATDDISVAAYRPVTDTVKTAVAGIVGDTIDREGLAALVSPVLLSRSVMASAIADDEPPPFADVARLVAWARARGPLELVTAPSIARRVDDESAVQLLECVDELGHQVRR